MPTKSTVRPSAVIAEEISSIHFNEPIKSRLYASRQVLREQEATRRSEYLLAFATNGTAPSHMDYSSVRGIVMSTVMDEYPKILTALAVLENSDDYKQIESVLEPLTEELESASASEESARQAAAAQVTDAMAKLDAEQAAAAAEIDKRGTLAAARNAVEVAKRAFAALAG